MDHRSRGSCWGKVGNVLCFPSFPQPFPTLRDPSPDCGEYVVPGWSGPTHYKAGIPLLLRWARDANHRVAGNHGGWVGLEEKGISPRRSRMPGKMTAHHANYYLSIASGIPHPPGQRGDTHWVGDLEIDEFTIRNPSPRPAVDIALCCQKFC